MATDLKEAACVWRIVTVRAGFTDKRAAKVGWVSLSGRPVVVKRHRRRLRSPSCQGEVALGLGLVLPDYRDVLRRGDVVSGFPIDFLGGLEIIIDQASSP